MRDYKPNKIYCSACGTEHFYRGAPPAECGNCGEAIGEHLGDEAGFTWQARPGEVIYLEDVDEHGSVIRVALEVRSTSRNNVRLGIVAPEEVVIRRAVIPYQGQCLDCGAVLRPGDGGRFCTLECRKAFEREA